MQSISQRLYICHCEQVIEAAERGFHVLCDKPDGDEYKGVPTDDRRLPSETACICKSVSCSVSIPVFRG